MRISTVAAIAAFCGIAGASHAGVLFGVASYSNFGVMSLYQINSATGVATIVGSTGLRQINGITFDGSTLWAYTLGGDLYKLDVNTGASTLFGAHPLTIPEGDIAFAGPGFAYATNASGFGRVAITGGAYTAIGNMGAAADDVSGLTIDSTGRVLGYSKNGAAEDTLLSIDPATGVATTIGGTGLFSSAAVGGLAFDADSGSLFLSDGNALYTVNASSGAATLVGAHGPLNFSGLAVVPAPGAAALLAGGVLVVSRRRRA